MEDHENRRKMGLTCQMASALGHLLKGTMDPEANTEPRDLVK